MIHYIKIEDKEHPFLYSLSASVEAEGIEVKGKDPVELSKEYLYLGFKYGAKLEGSKFPYSKKEFFLLCETDPPVFFEASKVFEKQLGKLLGEEGVKNLKASTG